MRTQDCLRPPGFKAVAVLAACLMASHAWAADADALRGAWKLEGYELAGQAREADGVLVFEDGRFGMVYTMGGTHGKLSGRAHAGPVEISGDVVRFGVKWWVEDVDGVARIATAVARDTKLEIQGDRLTLLFSNGAIQKLRRLPPPAKPQANGVWQVRSAADPKLPAVAASGLLLSSGGYFILVYTEGEGASATRGHSATGKVAGKTLQVDRRVSSVDGVGTVVAREGESELTLRGSGENRTVTDRAGRALTLVR